MPRRQLNTSGLRELLIASDDAGRERWRQPRPWTQHLSPEERELPMPDWGIDLRAGRAVVVSSAVLMCALSHAGLPHSEFCYGGSAYDKMFVLDERDQLTECPDERPA